MIELKKKEDFKEYIKQDKVLVDFYAEWCGPCKMLEPVLEEIEKENEITMIRVDTDNFLSLAREYRIISIPNLKLFEKGIITKEHTGLMRKEELIEWLKD